MKVTIHSALPLTTSQTKALEKKLSAIVTNADQFEYHVDPGLIGGLRIIAGSSTLDLSLKARLSQLKIKLNS